MRAHRIGHGGDDGDQLAQVARRHSLEIDDHASIPSGIDERRYRASGDSQDLRTAADTADYLWMKAISEIGSDKRRLPW